MEDEAEAKSFDSLFESIRGSRRWQIVFTFEAGICALLAGSHVLASVFLAAVPEYWCRIPALGANATTTKSLQNFTSPIVPGNDGTFQLSRCQYFDRNYSLVEAGIESKLDGKVMDCTAWFYDTSTYESTVVSEWNLICNNKWMMSSVQATFMIGVMSGEFIISVISDRWGRRRIILLSTILFNISTFAAIFATSLVPFLILRFISGATVFGARLVLHVLIAEVTDLKSRTWFMNAFDVLFNSGQFYMAFLAYFIRDWRQLQLILSVPSLLMLIYFWRIPESPRWLYAKDRRQEATSVLAKIAKANGSYLPSKETLNDYIEDMHKERKQIPEKTNDGNVFNNIIIIFATRNMRRRCLTMMYIFMIVNMVYYGLPLSGENINVSIHVLIFATTSMGVIIAFLVPVLITRFGRKMPFFLTTFLSGVPSLLVLAIPKERVLINLILAVLGKAFMDFSFIIFFVYSAELFPTNVRTTAMGMASVCGRIGGTITPYVVHLLGDIYYAMPPVIFSILSFIAGLLVLLLPETGKKQIPESIEEVEEMNK